MRKPPGTLSLKKLGPGKIYVANVWTQNTCILAFLHTFILISGNPTKIQKDFIKFLTELDDLKKIVFLGSNKFFALMKHLFKKTGTYT